MQYLIANWKAELIFFDVQAWITTFSRLVSEDKAFTQALLNNELCIVLSPPYPFISYVKEHLQGAGIHIGAQDISTKDHGKFTGEVTAQALKGMVEFAIVGHSERRSHFKETDTELRAKIQQAVAHSIQPVLCIRGTGDTIHQEAQIIAYEPVGAIGSGKNEDPGAVVAIKKQLFLPEGGSFLYGGSVDIDNIKSYHDTGVIDGYLVGTASLDAEHFFSLAKALL